jgi:hypothetical protein
MGMIVSDSKTGCLPPSVHDKRPGRHVVSWKAQRTDANNLLQTAILGPDHSATSQTVSDLEVHLAGCGHDVLAMFSRQR